MKRKICIVEDDEGIVEVYTGALEDQYDLEFFDNGKDFLKRMSSHVPDLILLDIMLPDMDGFEILSALRSINEKVPVIIVSAKGDEISSVKGLNKGADDYIAKPFSVLQLIARIKAALRRSEMHISRLNGFEVDNNLYRITYNSTELPLTLKEFYLLKYFISYPGKTIDRDTLFKEVWGEDFVGETRTLDMHISSLREKLKNAGIDCIKTVRGVGYRLEL